MKAGTLFSGIGAPECAMPDLDWRWCAEIDPFASAVHKARFPGVPNLGDVNAIDPDAVEPVDLVVFGSPCQSFSIAGRRLGLDDPRGNLALVALRLVSLIRPRWLVFENVPGLLSSDGGRDFGAFLGLLGECGYGWAYRVLDAQHFGVPQRRRRVFVIGHLGDWRSAAAVLFEPESLRGNPAPRREAGEGVAASLNGGPASGGRPGCQPDDADSLIAFDARQSDVCVYGDRAAALDTDGFTQAIAHSLRAEGFDASEDGTGRGVPLVAAPLTHGVDSQGKGGYAGRRREDDTNLVVTHALDAHSAGQATEDDTGRGVPLTLAIRGRGDSHDLEYRSDGIANAVLTPNGGRGGIGCGAVAFDTTQITSALNRSQPKAGDPCHPLASGAHPPAIAFDPTAQQPEWSIDRPLKTDPLAVASGMSVRRLTPVECEKLQGFPPGWTAITWRGKPAADGPRYRSLGNSMAVPVVRWLLGRIAEVDAL